MRKLDRKLLSISVENHTKKAQSSYSAVFLRNPYSRRSAKAATYAFHNLIIKNIPPLTPPKNIKPQKEKKPQFVCFYFLFRFNCQKMLRRKPTAITLTSEDVLAYEKAHSPSVLASNPGAAGGAVATNSSRSGPADPNDELKPLPGDKARVVRAGGAASSREERIVGH